MKSHRLLRGDAERIWRAALRAADPEAAVRRQVRRDGDVLSIGARRWDLRRCGRVWILGAGKAAAPMGRAMEKLLGRSLEGGLVVTKRGHGLALERIEVLEAGHPLPDSNSVDAGRRFEEFARRLAPGDLALCLFSGGASSLVVAPAEGVRLRDKIQTTDLLIRAGADIAEINAVRKHLSRLKGGGLGRLLAPVQSATLLISDVVGDDVSTIASGPTAPDPTTFADCCRILQKHGILGDVPAAVRKRLELGASGRIGETPKPGEPAFGDPPIVLAGVAEACTAALRAARRLGYRSMVLTSRLAGDNGEAARLHMSVAAEIAGRGRPLRAPACVVSGGETTVRVTGSGKGGRNQDFVLRCVRLLAQLAVPCVVCSVGTDGTDGPTEAAGAIADNTSLARSVKFGAQFLDLCAANCDSHAFFGRLGDLVVTGPTRTNVNDLHLVLIG